MGSDGCVIALAIVHCMFQSTLPHGERRDVRLAQLQPTLVVSIHAPAWGATVAQRTVARDDMFQSTLPHGERLSDLYWLYYPNVFQSTLPHGERQFFRISSASNLGFNPRSRMGSDSPTS